jgi:hypothetical protein
LVLLFLLLLLSYPPPLLFVSSFVPKERHILRIEERHIVSVSLNDRRRHQNNITGLFHRHVLLQRTRKRDRKKETKSARAGLSVFFFSSSSFSFLFLGASSLIRLSPYLIDRAANGVDAQMVRCPCLIVTYSKQKKKKTKNVSAEMGEGERQRNRKKGR